MSNLNQSEAEKLANLVAEAVFDRWQRDNGITKDTLKEIITEELTKKRPQEKKADASAYGYAMYGLPYN